MTARKGWLEERSSFSSGVNPTTGHHTFTLTYTHNKTGRPGRRPDEKRSRGIQSTELTEFEANRKMRHRRRDRIPGLENGSTRGKNKTKQERRAAETKRRSSTAGTGWVVDVGGGRKGKRGATPLLTCLTGSAQSQDGRFPGRSITGGDNSQLQAFFCSACDCRSSQIPPIKTNHGTPRECGSLEPCRVGKRRTCLSTNGTDLCRGTHTVMNNCVYTTATGHVRGTIFANFEKARRCTQGGEILRRPVGRGGQATGRPTTGQVFRADVA